MKKEIKRKCPECKKEMEELESIDFKENGETYFWCQHCLISD
jgi:endogenous inhibitor of DNA gyrase (YacG/DUF329 family)